MLGVLGHGAGGKRREAEDQRAAELRRGQPGLVPGATHAGNIHERGYRGGDRNQWDFSFEGAKVSALLHFDDHGPPPIAQLYALRKH